MKPTPEFIVYLVGIALAGFFYEPVKSALGGEWLFLGCAVAYAVALRVLGHFVAGVLAARRPSNDA